MAIVKGYDLKEVIGTGGFGTVYSAVRLTDKKVVAIKKIKKRSNTDPDVKKEIIALKNLDHSNIVKFIDEFIYDGVQYIVMEYCPYGTLRDYVNRKGKLTDDCAAHVLRQLVRGVQYIHSKNMMHRDLTAQNVLINFIGQSGKLEVKITDFGLATVIRQGLQHTCAGTPGYMDGNVINRNYTKIVDVYALGGILFLMLTGLVPDCDMDSAFVENRVSKEAEHLIRRMRCPVERDRISLKEILCSSFMKKNRSSICSRSVSRDSRSFPPDHSFEFRLERKPAVPYPRIRPSSAQPPLRVPSQKPFSKDSAFGSYTGLDTERGVTESQRYNRHSRERGSFQNLCSDARKEIGISRGRERVSNVLSDSVNKRRRSTASRDPSSSSRINVSNLVWPLKEIFRIPESKQCNMVKGVGRFLFKKNGPIIYEAVQNENRLCCIVVVDFPSTPQQQRMRVFKPRTPCSLPSKDDPPAPWIAHAIMAFDSLEEVVESCNGGNKNAVVLYKRIVAAYYIFINTIEKIVLRTSKDTESRLMLGGNFEFNLRDGRQALVKIGKAEIIVTKRNNVESELSEEEFERFKSARDFILKFDAFLEENNFSYIGSFPVFISYLQESPKESKDFYGEPYGSKHKFTSTKTQKSHGGNAEQEKSTDSSRELPSAFCKENIKPCRNPTLLSPSKYKLRQSTDRKDITGIVLLDGNRKQKLKIHPTKDNVIYLEIGEGDGKKSKSFSFDFQKRDYTAVPDSLVDMLYTLMNARDNFYASKKGSKRRI